MRYYNEETGQEQNGSGGLYDAHVKPMTASRAETNAANAAGIALLLIILIWWFKTSWNWSLWVIRYSRSYIMAIGLFSFNVLYPMWVLGWLNDFNRTYEDYVIINLMYDTVELNAIVFYFLVTGIVVWLTICRYISFPNHIKEEIKELNIQLSEEQEDQGIIGYMFSNPVVSVPVSYWIGRNL